MRRSHSVSGSSISGNVGKKMPAAGTTMSMRPKADTTASATARTDARSRTSARCAMARDPRVSTVACALSSAMSTTHTAAPASCNRRAMARPRPEPAPVTTAVLPERSSISVMDGDCRLSPMGQLWHAVDEHAAPGDSTPRRSGGWRSPVVQSYTHRHADLRVPLQDVRRRVRREATDERVRCTGVLPQRTRRHREAAVGLRVNGWPGHLECFRRRCRRGHGRAARPRRRLRLSLSAGLSTRRAGPLIRALDHLSPIANR